MRKFTLLLAFLAFTGMTFAQTADCGFTKGGVAEKALTAKSTKAYGDVIWSEDFNGTKWSSTVATDGDGYMLDVNATLPEGWSIVDNNELDYFWHWSDVGPRGRYTSPNASSAGGDASFVPNPSILDYFPEETSLDNGFMMLEGDYYNTAASGLISSNPVDMDAVLEYGPIDMSNFPGAVFSMKTVYRTCCSWDRLLGLAIGIPDGNGGMIWSDEIRLNILTGNNTVTLAAERDVHVNISKVKAGDSYITVGGESEVYFRLHKTLASHYYWIIDDITFYEPPTDDMIVEDQWFDYMYNALDPDMGQSSTPSFNFWGGYTQIPQSLAASFVQFRAAVYNNGTSDAANAKLNVKVTGAADYTVSSAGKTLGKFLRDTLMVAADFTPAEMGHYQVSMTVAMDAADQANEDNGLSVYEFDVVDNVYARVRPEMEDDFYTAGPRDWASGGYDGDVCAQPYDFPANVEQVSLKAASVYFAEPATTAEQTAIENGEFAMYARVYKIDEAGEIVTAGISSELYTLTMADANTWVELNFVDEGNLIVPGDQTLYIGIETYTGATDQSLRFEIGADINGPKQPSQGGLIYLSSQGGWYLTGDNYAINLILNTEVTPKVNVTFNVDMTQPIEAGLFVAGTDVVYATGNFTGWTEPGQEGSVMLSDDNSDNIYTATVEMDANYGEMQYKYFKNAGWAGGEWDGEPNRIANVADADLTLNDEWVVISINDFNFDAISIAPNPFNGELIIKNAAGVSQIVVSNVLGQTVMTVNEVSNMVTLSTDALNNGVYFVTFVDSNNNSRTERVVKR